MSDKQAILDDSKTRCDALSARLADFAVFDQTFTAFNDSVSDFADTDFAGKDYEVMNRLRGVLAQQTESALLAQAFIDIWFCSNFASTIWRQLIQMNPSHIRLAIEHAYYVFAYSSANGGAELASLISQANCADEARPCLERIARLNDWSARWAEGLLPPHTDASTTKNAT